MEEGRIVRNSHLNSEWGDEEIEGEIPFVKGKKFGIQIRTSGDSFTVLVRGIWVF